MIPLKLTICGLYSYRTAQTIDFSKLTEAGIFGIFGNVGSGKSTILEAISFALYAESERLNSRENRNYNMMNLKSNELLIDFEFRAESNSVYRFTVKGKRNSKKYDDVKTFERAAYKLTNGQWLPISPESVESITGLNYKNFKRTIIIPQGRFQEFLQLNNADRTTMLKELFNLSKFELYDKVRRLDEANDLHIENMTGQLMAIGEVDPDQITVLEKNVTELIASLKILNEEIKKKQVLDQELDQLKKLLASVINQKQILAELLKSESRMLALEKEIREFENLRLLFKPDLDQLAFTEESHLNGQKELDKNNRDFADLQLKSAAVENEFLLVKPEYDNRDRLIRESEELIKFIDIRNCEKEITELSNRITNGKKTLAGTEEVIREKKSSVIQLENKNNEQKSNLPDLKKISEIKVWFSRKESISLSINTLNSKIKLHNKTIHNLLSEAGNKITSQGIVVTLQDNFHISEILSLFENNLNTLQLNIQAVDSEILELELQNQLEKYAAELHEGKACPLCGSTDHPEILNPANVTNQLKEKKQLKKETEDQIKKLLKSAKELEGINNEIAGLQKQKEKDETELKILMQDIVKHDESFNWDGFDSRNEKLLTDEFHRFESLKNSIEAIENEIKKINSELAENEKNKEAYNIALTNLERQLAENTSKKQLLASQIKILDIENYGGFSIEKLKEMASALLTKQEEISRKFQKNEKERIEIRSKMDILEGTLKSNKQNLEILREQKLKVQSTIDSKLKSNGNLQMEYVLNILHKNMDSIKIKAEIEQFKQNVEATKKILEISEREVAGRAYDEAEHEKLKKEIKETDLSVKSKYTEQVILQEKIKNQKINAERFKQLKNALEELEIRRQSITELKNLFRGSGFVNYISTVYLQNLCKAANERFYKLTRHKLGMEMTDDNNFQVRDYMNDGKLRSVKTLSGGQTFQASLSLALSLADSIHRISGSSENFFFLDEGFGTLDKESLDVVFDTLKSLRKENRIVGMISHVEDMQQEIETFLLVNNDEEKGSIVKASWE